MVTAPSATGGTAAGDEVDLVVERPDDDAVIAIEVKAGARVAPHDWKGLRTFREEMGSRFRAGLVMYTGDTAYRVEEGIYAVPIDKLWEGARRPGERARPSGGGALAGNTATSARNDRVRVLTADGDPLRRPFRSAVQELIDRTGIGEASYWEVAVVPPENVHFGDFYTRSGVAGALHRFNAWSGGDTEPVGQCVAVAHRPRRSPMGHKVPGFGALVHPLGFMAFILSAAEERLPARVGWTIGDWSQDLVRFTHQILSPHTGSWTYWSAGRRLRTGQPRFSGMVGPNRETMLAEAVVDDPPHRGVPLTGALDSEAFLLATTFYEWFGIPVQDLGPDAPG